MEFGRLTDLRKVDFTLPTPEAALFAWNTSETESTKIAVQRNKLYLGAPVWAHPSFLGKLYPKKLQPRDFLEFYAKSFNCIELNSTFYGVPSPERIAIWRSKVSPAFRFCPKATKNITHNNGGVPRREIADFFRGIEHFDSHLGLCFLQFPPELGPTQWRSLQSILRLLPKDFKIAIELRHPGWFAKPEALQWLMQLGVETNVALVITDTAGRRDVLHSCFPKRHTMIRFSGDALVDTDFTRLDQWTQSLDSFFASGLEEAYFFIHQQVEGNCVELAEHLIAQMPHHPLPAIKRVQIPQLALPF